MKIIRNLDSAEKNKKRTITLWNIIVLQILEKKKNNDISAYSIPTVYGNLF
mgnify:CR=1 FL=1